MIPKLSIIITFFFFFLLSASQSDDEAELYFRCQPRPFVCGGLAVNISYPFQVAGRPFACGHPGYALRCTRNSTLTTTIENREYEVMAIDYSILHLAVADASYAGDSCPHPAQNTTVDSSLYRYTELDKAVTLFLNCTFPGEISPGIRNISCNAGNTSYYVAGDGSSGGGGGMCGAAVEVVMHQSVVDLVMEGQVGLGDALQQGLTLRWTAADGWCDECVAIGGLCGYNLSSESNNMCICARGSCSSAGEDRVAVKVGVGLAVALVCFLLVSISLYFWISPSQGLNTLIFWRKNKISQAIEDFLDTLDNIGPKRYKYSALKKITKYFSEKLGQGGYGSVFRGQLPDGRSVAVKILTDAAGNGDEFVNEVASIGRTSHVNIVSLLGYSSEGSKRALIYQFMSNGSLEKYIYSDNLKSSLGWEKLYQIAIGIARGLEYLHRGCTTHIVHFDIKPHNILLDQDFCPKISDFGLAKLCQRKDSIFSAMGTRGTVGYIAPEVFSRNFGVVSSKSDVYSYGMMVLEMVGGRNRTPVGDDSCSDQYFFPHWIHQHFHEVGRVDVSVQREEIAKKMILVGLWCIQTNPGSRPSMSKVVDMLENSVDDIEMPPKPS